jgi:hypothetical protein
MARKKIGHLGSRIALLRYGFADELIAGIYCVCQSALAKQYLGSGLVDTFYPPVASLATYPDA